MRNGEQLERELMLRLAGSASRREAQTERIRELARSADYERLHHALASQALLPLLGSRVVEAAGEAVPSWFEESARYARERTRQWALVIEGHGRRMAGALEDAGIHAVALKGPALARDVHGDTGLRYSSDVDLLVDRSQFWRAVGALEKLGYWPERRSAWHDGLPLFEVTMRSGGPLPAVDLHWRLHWLEARSASEMIARSDLDSAGNRRLTRTDELAALLLFYARDGFWGLRLAVDIATWWDRFGSTVSDGALVELVERHPEFGCTFCASALAAEQLVGLPARSVMGDRRPTRRIARAVRMSNWGGGVPASRHRATLALVDLLLSPPGQAKEALRRHLAPPATVVEEMYGFSYRLTQWTWIARVRYAAIVGWRFVPGVAAALWATRRGRRLSPLPD